MALSFALSEILGALSRESVGVEPVASDQSLAR